MRPSDIGLCEQNLTGHELAGSDPGPVPALTTSPPRFHRALAKPMSCLQLFCIAWLASQSVAAPGGDSVEPASAALPPRHAKVTVNSQTYQLRVMNCEFEDQTNQLSIYARQAANRHGGELWLTIGERGQELIFSIDQPRDAWHSSRLQLDTKQFPLIQWSGLTQSLNSKNTLSLQINCQDPPSASTTPARTIEHRSQASQP